MIRNLRIGICGSASVGKTTLARALARDLELPCIDEEMRAYLERSGCDLTRLPSAEVEQILLQLWEQRRVRELAEYGFVADNCAIDFAAYALYYGCLSATGSSHLLTEARRHLACYDAIVLLPWGVLPYVQDGVRPADRNLQLRYQTLLEGLLRNNVPDEKLHVLPDDVVRLDDRRAWVAQRLTAPHRRADIAVAQRLTGAFDAKSSQPGMTMEVAP